MFGLTCVSSGEVKPTVDSQTNTQNDHVKFHPSRPGMVIEPQNLTAALGFLSTMRRAFSLECVKFTIYSLIFLIAQLFDLTKSHLLGYNGFFQFPPSDWITSTIGFIFFFLQLLIMC